MKKPVLAAIIATDLMVIGGASFVLMNRLQKVDIPASAPEENSSENRTQPVPMATPEAPSQPQALPPQAATPPPEIKRRILFKIKVPNAKEVQISGDFNDWKPEDLAQGDKHIWTLTIPISPGVYTYNYIIDGQRKVKDPNNPRATPDRKSILTVKGNS